MIASAWATVRAAAKQWREDYDPEISKSKWAAASKNFIRILGKHLGAKAMKVTFNPGGPGVSGEGIGFIQFENNRMMYIHLSAEFNGYFREVKSFTDYTGGPNNSFSLSDPIDDPVERIQALEKYQKPCWP